MNRRVIRGLYVIADTDVIPQGKLTEHVRGAVRGGAQLVQYRNKHARGNDVMRELHELRELCRACRVPLLINDDISLVLAVDADGVHLGRDDEGLATARAQLGKGKLIGASCYNDLARANEARAQGADYVAFGSFYASPTKPDAVKANPMLLVRARRELDLPIVAIGGITPENGALLVDAGADALAVISGVFSQPDIAAAAARYSRLFEPAVDDAEPLQEDLT